MKSNRAKYQENGFILLKNFLPKIQIEIVLEEARRFFVAQMLRLPFSLRPALGGFSIRRRYVPAYRASARTFYELR